MDPGEWRLWQQLIDERGIVIDRPRGEAHPLYPDMIYPYDYGYVPGTAAADGHEVDAFVGRVQTGLVGVITLVHELTCGLTGQPIFIELTPNAVERVDPPGAVVTAVRSAGQLADIRSAVCQHGQFFASPQAATQWASAHPEGEIRPVEEAFALDRAVVTQLGWALP
jgi:alkylmercury lyase-like protein/inorganic pyrophosphatase